MMRELWMMVGVILSISLIASFSTMSPTATIIANVPPQWDYATSEFVVNEELQLDLTQAFFDPDGDVLSFSVAPSDEVTAGLSGTTLIVRASPGVNTVVSITASDGKVETTRNIEIIGAS